MNEERKEQHLSMEGVVAVAEKEQQPQDRYTLEADPAETTISSVAEQEFVPLPLFGEGEVEEFRTRWQNIQTGFVDDPRSSVTGADALIAEVIESIEDTFAREQSALEDQWNQRDEASTEDLRLVLKRYRSFFDQLLTLQS